MEGNHHSLSLEFPEYKDKIHLLKTSNAHFRKLFEKYDELDKAIARAESRVDSIDELSEERLRKERLQVKDQIYGMLSDNKS